MLFSPLFRKKIVLSFIAISSMDDHIVNAILLEVQRIHEAKSGSYYSTLQAYSCPACVDPPNHALLFVFVDQNGDTLAICRRGCLGPVMDMVLRAVMRDPLERSVRGVGKGVTAAEPVDSVRG
jgi:hypothetical protein